LGEKVSYLGRGEKTTPWLNDRLVAEGVTGLSWGLECYPVENMRRNVGPNRNLLRHPRYVGPDLRHRERRSGRSSESSGWLQLRGPWPTAQQNGFLLYSAHSGFNEAEGGRDPFLQDS